MRRLQPAIYALNVVTEVFAFTWQWASAPMAPTSAFSVNLGWAGLASMVVLLISSAARRSRALDLAGCHASGWKW